MSWDSAISALRISLPPPPLPNSWSPCRELSRSLIACLCFTKSKKHTSCVLESPIEFDSPFQEACCSWRSVLDFPFQPHTFQRGWAQDRQGTLSWVSSAICGDCKHLVVLWYLLRISVLIMFAQTSESCLGVFYYITNSALVLRKTDLDGNVLIRACPWVLYSQESMNKPSL